MKSNAEDDAYVSNGHSAVTRVLLVDDHPVVRQGLKHLIDACPDMAVCGEADEAAEALNAVQTLDPDIVLVDISMQGMSGIDFLKRIREDHPRTRSVVFSMHDESLYAERALRAGAMGYVMKRQNATEILDAIRKAMRGEFWVSQDIEKTLFQKALGQHRNPAKSPSHGLTDRELEIFEMLGQGRGTSEIANRLKLSVKTVESHRARIKEKLGVQTATELIRHAVRWVERGEATAPPFAASNGHGV